MPSDSISRLWKVLQRHGLRPDVQLCALCAAWFASLSCSPCRPAVPGRLQLISNPNAKLAPEHPTMDGPMCRFRLPWSRLLENCGGLAERFLGRGMGAIRGDELRRRGGWSSLDGLRKRAIAKAYSAYGQRMPNDGKPLYRL
ncbi:hypothetical protein K491DRAFT_109139 [Lophiostoma macrostomum CBS 122681]|uniref:Uncharacterized protein n=1 Tax=Lophiostoma macrostomum CBS 122681 TaxID=1314788 RepID=A0A6A6TJ64_9PLEO|nr:hypothetical protein K491DRAFT_109139 [Lophiostoma macrostomum CBS 122681]